MDMLSEYARFNKENFPMNEGVMFATDRNSLQSDHVRVEEIGTLERKKDRLGKIYYVFREDADVFQSRWFNELCVAFVLVLSNLSKETIGWDNYMFACKIRNYLMGRGEFCDAFTNVDSIDSEILEVFEKLVQEGYIEVIYVDTDWERRIMTEKRGE